MPRVTQHQRELHAHDEQDFLTASAHAGDASPYRRDDYWGAELASSATATTSSPSIAKKPVTTRRELGEVLVDGLLQAFPQLWMELAVAREVVAAVGEITPLKRW